MEPVKDLEKIDPIEKEWLKYEKDGNYNKFIDILNEEVETKYIYFKYIDKLILKGLSNNNKSIIKCCMDIYCDDNNKKYFKENVKSKSNSKYDKEEKLGISHLNLLLRSNLFKNNTNNEEKYKIIEIFLSKKNINDLNLLDIFINIFLPTGEINNDMNEINIYIDKIIEIYKKSFPNNDEYTIYFINKLFLIKNKNTLVIKKFLELFINKFIPKDYKFDKKDLGFLFHIGEISILKENKLINIEFLEYCFDKWTENIDIYLKKYNFNLTSIISKYYKIKSIKWDNIKNKALLNDDIYDSDDYDSDDYDSDDFDSDDFDSDDFDSDDYDNNIKVGFNRNWINKIDIFLEQKSYTNKKII